MTLFLIATLILLVAAVWAVVTYNRLVRDRNRVAQSWSDVDVQLRRRHDLVPRLVEVVKGYAGYERALLESVTQLRSLGTTLRSPSELTPVESQLAGGLQQLIAIAEAYPDLKASQNFLALQSELAGTENQIQFARRYYNGAVNLYNTQIERFPNLLIARSFAFRPADFFDRDGQEQAVAPEVRI
ncbi:MAG: LemA family protein [Steroidobacteraceae bacterium]